MSPPERLRASRPEHARDYPRVLGPFVLGAREPHGGEMPAWLGAAESEGRASACRLQALPMALPLPAGAGARIQRATTALRRLGHRNLTAGLGLALVEGRLLLVERHLSGTTLAALRPGTFPPQIACWIVRELGRGLRYLARRRLDPLVLGRLAPERIHVGWSATVKLLGAGLALARREGLLARPVDSQPNRALEAQQVRALGMLLWELLCGQADGVSGPHLDRVSGPHLALESGRRRSALPRGLPAELYAVIARALSPQPGQRFRSLRALLSALGPFSARPTRARRGLLELVDQRVHVRRVRDQQAAALNQAMQTLAAPATHPVRPVPLRATPRRWPVVWATALAAAGLGAFALLPPAPPPSISLVARTPVAAGRPAPGGQLSPFDVRPVADAGVGSRAGERAATRPAGRRPAGSPRTRPAPGAATAERRARAARALAALEAAEARFQWRDLSGAEALAQEAVGGLPDEPRAHYLLGLVLLAMDKATEAARAFERALALDPDLADAAAKLRIAQERAAVVRPPATEATEAAQATGDR